MAPASLQPSQCHAGAVVRLALTREADCNVCELRCQMSAAVMRARLTTSAIVSRRARWRGRRVDRGAIAPVLWTELHHRSVEFGRDRQIAVEPLIGPLPESVEGVHYRSSRRALKNGCRTFPSADFARYSISASSFGSTQMPLWAMRLAYGWL